MITTAQIVGSLADNGMARVPVEFVYDTDDPWAVRLNFRPGVVWMFALELLADGLRWPVGDGDVRLWPTAGVDAVMLHLRAPSASALIALPFGEVARFVERAEVLAGQQPEVSLDHELSKLLDGA